MQRQLDDSIMLRARDGAELASIVHRQGTAYPQPYPMAAHIRGQRARRSREAGLERRSPRKAANRKHSLRLVGELLLAQHDPGQIGMHGIDLAHRPAVERLRDHNVDEVQNLHVSMVAKLMRSSL